MERSITIKIAGSEYSLKARTPEEEQLMRLAAEAINQKLNLFDAKFPNKTLSDKLSFVALNETISRISWQRKFNKAGEDAACLQEDVESYLKSIEK